MEFAAEHDVVILGAGPAGTSAAIRLAQMGLDVGLVERLRFPRSHVGICISDQTVALIDYLGLGREFADAKFWRRSITAVRWGDTETRYVEQSGYHVDRAILEHNRVESDIRETPAPLKVWRAGVDYTETFGGKLLITSLIRDPDLRFRGTIKFGLLSRGDDADSLLRPQ